VLAWASVLVVVALAVRTFWLSAAYFLRLPGSGRFRVESAAFLFVAVGLLVRLLINNGRETSPSAPAATPTQTLPVWTWAIFWILALALYWSTLSIGLLSDDFILVGRAARWDFTPVTAMLFRPVPLFFWALLLHAGGTPTVLHVLSVTLHATNAYLTCRVVEPWVQDRRWIICAGLLFLVSPLAPEAVAWCSGVFDVMATMFVLLMVIVGRRYDERPDWGSRCALYACAAGAVLSKETGAIGGALVLVDAWARGRVSRPLIRDIGVLFGLIGVFSALRLAPLLGSARLSIGWYQIQRGIFGIVGALAEPWHDELSAAHPWIPIVSALLVLSLTAAYFLRRPPARSLPLAVAAVLVIALSIVPVWPLFFVAPDLRGARYAYLAAVGWAALIAITASSFEDRAPQQIWSSAAVAGLLVMSSFGLVTHLEPWRDAARLRDQIEAAVRSSAQGCRELTISALPDEVRGAYVFQNGVREAFARDLRVTVTSGDAQGCVFRWTDGRLVSQVSKTAP
jgi:hypothetical protein